MLKLRVRDPSGETRAYEIGAGTTVDRLTLGRDPAREIPLRDTTVPPLAAVIDMKAPGQTAWIRAVEGFSGLRAGQLRVREAELDPDVVWRIGESELRIVGPGSAEAPGVPPGCRPWHTYGETGRDLLAIARRAALTPLAIYVAGETGTGKEILARLLHAWSEHHRGPFVALNCGAVTPSLAESELFGHIRGAFTGADSARTGALMQAHGGTLFLDEVADLPVELQVKLLRFLEDGEVRPVGSDRAVHARVRLICATHKSLASLVKSGHFRKDLFFRLASVTLEIPPLRHRPEDIEGLARVFVAELGRTLSSAAVARLQAHSWPGNARELRHAVERAAGLSEAREGALPASDFDFLLAGEELEATAPGHSGPPAYVPALLTLDEMERYMLLKALRLSGGHRGQAAKLLGVARSTVFEMVRRHGILGPRRAYGLREATSSR